MGDIDVHLLSQLADPPLAYDPRCAPAEGGAPSPKCPTVPNPDYYITDAIIQAAGNDEVLSDAEVQKHFTKLQKQLTRYDPSHRYGFWAVKDPAEMTARIHDYTAARARPVFLQTVVQLRAWYQQLHGAMSIHGVRPAQAWQDAATALLHLDPAFLLEQLSAMAVDPVFSPLVGRITDLLGALPAQDVRAKLVQWLQPEPASETAQSIAVIYLRRYMGNTAEQFVLRELPLRYAGLIYTLTPIDDSEKRINALEKVAETLLASDVSDDHWRALYLLHATQWITDFQVVNSYRTVHAPALFAGGQERLRKSADDPNPNRRSLAKQVMITWIGARAWPEALQDRDPDVVNAVLQRVGLVHLDLQDPIRVIYPNDERDMQASLERIVRADSTAPAQRKLAKLLLTKIKVYTYTAELLRDPDQHIALQTLGVLASRATVLGVYESPPSEPPAIAAAIEPFLLSPDQGVFDLAASVTRGFRLRTLYPTLLRQFTARVGQQIAQLPPEATGIEIVGQLVVLAVICAQDLEGIDNNLPPQFLHAADVLLMQLADWIESPDEKARYAATHTLSTPNIQSWPILAHLLPVANHRIYLAALRRFANATSFIEQARLGEIIGYTKEPEAPATLARLGLALLPTLDDGKKIALFQRWLPHLRSNRIERSAWEARCPNALPETFRGFGWTMIKQMERNLLTKEGTPNRAAEPITVEFLRHALAFGQQQSPMPSALEQHRDRPEIALLAAIALASYRLPEVIPLLRKAMRAPADFTTSANLAAAAATQLAGFERLEDAGLWKGIERDYMELHPDFRKTLHTIAGEALNALEKKYGHAQVRSAPIEPIP